LAPTGADAKGSWSSRPWRRAKRTEKRRDMEARETRRLLGLSRWQYEEEAEELLCLSIALRCGFGQRRKKQQRLVNGGTGGVRQWCVSRGEDGSGFRTWNGTYSCREVLERQASVNYVSITLMSSDQCR
jgi:hypothetical protein